MSTGLVGGSGLRAVGLAISQQYQKHRSNLEFSLAKLASGDRMALPGRNPAELSISERMKAQVKSQEMGIQNIQTTIALLNTSGSYLDTLNEIVLKMTEIAVGAASILPEGVSTSENNPKLQNLNKEFQLLKKEYAYITRESDFNEKSVIGQDYLMSFDAVSNRLRHWQINGGDETSVDYDFSSSATDARGTDLKFDSSLNYTMGGEGRYLYYIGTPSTGNYDVRRFDFESDTMEILSSGGDTTTEFSAAADSAIVIDQDNTVYVSGIGSPKNIYQINPDSLVRQEMLPSADMLGSSFSVFDNVITYINSSNEIVQRNTITSTTTNTGYFPSAETDYSTSFQEENSALSTTGRYVADIAATGVIRVLNWGDSTEAIINLSGTPDISDIRFSADENRIYYLNGDNKTISYVNLDVDIDGTMNLTEGGSVVQGKNSASLQGLAMGGAGPGMRGAFGIGLQDGTTYELADARMAKMGNFLEANLRSQDNASEALTTLENVVHKLSAQKSKVAGYALSMSITLPAYQDYVSQISSVVGRLRNTDIAKTTSEITYQQMRTQAAMAVLGKFNNIASSAVQLLSSL